LDGFRDGMNVSQAWFANAAAGVDHDASGPSHLTGRSSFLKFHLPEIITYMMSFPIAFIIAFITLPHSHGFTPVMPSDKWQRTKSASTSPIFDTEQSSPWSIQEWSVDFPDTLNTDFTDIPTSSFLHPSEEDLRAVEKLVASPVNTGVKSESESKLLESEFPEMKKKIRVNVRETGTDSIKNYIKTMCNHELLNKNEEIILAREIQILLKWEKEREDLENQLLRYVVDNARWDVV